MYTRCNILLTSSGERSHIVEVIRSSQRAGIIAAIDINPHATVRLMVDEFTVVPPISAGELYADAVLSASLQFGINAVLPLRDDEARVLSNYRQRFAVKGVKVLVGRPEITSMLGDKFAAALWLQERGFRSPPTVMADTNPHPNYPLVIKPRIQQGGRGMCIIASKSELPRQLAGMVAQPFVKGTEYTIDILADEGRVLAVVPTKVLYQRYGATHRGISVEHSDLIDLGKALGEAVGYTGTINVDVIESCGMIYILDVNPRVGALPYVAACCPRYIDELLSLGIGEHPEVFLGQYIYGQELHRVFRFIKLNEFSLTSK